MDKQLTVKEALEQGYDKYVYPQIYYIQSDIKLIPDSTTLNNNQQ